MYRKRRKWWRIWGTLEMFPIWLHVLKYYSTVIWNLERVDSCTSSKHEVTCGTAINACAVAALWAAFIALLLFLLIQSQTWVFQAVMVWSISPMCCSSGSWSLVSRRPIGDSLSFATVHLNLQLIACPVHCAPIFPCKDKALALLQELRTVKLQVNVWVQGQTQPHGRYLQEICSCSNPNQASLKLRIYHESTHSKQQKGDLLHCSTADGNWVRCIQSQVFPGASPLPAEVVVLNSAMRGCERSGRWIEALMLLEDTKVLGADEVSILI